MNKNFWNGWDFRSIIQIIIIVIGFVITFTRLDAKVESDKREVGMEINYLKERIYKLESNLEKIDNKLEKIYYEVKNKK